MNYRPEIDGLRAIAVIAVILCHAGFKQFGGGYVGVDIFFVISGYLITSILLAELEKNTFSLLDFYERRLRRILPALFGMLFFCLPFVWFFLTPDAIKSFSESLVAVTVFASNILFWNTSGYFDTSSEFKPLIHTWSLAVEEQYYLIFPLFLLLTKKIGRQWVVGLLGVAFLVSLTTSQWLSANHPSFNFYMLPTRGWELLIGAFIAFYHKRHNIKNRNSNIESLASFLGCLLIAYSIFVYNDQTPFPSIYTLAPTIGTALIVIFTTDKTVVGKLLSSRPFVAIGLISYSAYLWHQPIFAFHRLINPKDPNLLLMGILAGLSLVIGYLSWKYIESPFRKKGKFSRKNIYFFSILGSVFFILIGVTGIIISEKVSQPSVNLQKIYDSSHDFSTLKDLKVLGNEKNMSGVLIGDSHAESLGLALNEILEGANLGVKPLLAIGCPPVRGLYRFDIPSIGEGCNATYISTYNEILSNQSIKFVIIAARFTLYLESDRFDNKEGGIEKGVTEKVIFDDINSKNTLRDLSSRKKFLSNKFIQDIQLLLKSGKKVILVYPIPEVGWNTPVFGMNMANESQNSITLSTSYSRYQERNAFAIHTLDQIGTHENLIRIYPDRILCNTFVKHRCVAINNSISFYRDTNHLSNTGARLVLGRAMKDALKD
jgi:peptidoglycan/LPS O-acetylase OafA/YrhL